ncbi:MAG: endonuclease/exonuclease/phosphatase family protein [Phycisphaerales bacterium]
MARIARSMACGGLAGRLFAGAALLVVGSVGMLGCASGGSAAAPASRITIDGDVGDWPADVVVTGDADWVYLRFRVAGQASTLQAAPETLSILLDADDNRATGAPIPELPAASSMGIDLEIQFSPMTDAGVPASGVSAIAIDATGATERLSHADLDFHFSPTFAASATGWYEARIARRPTGSGLLAPTVLQGRGIRGVMGLYDAAGNIAGASEPFRATLPPAGSGAVVSSAPIPATPRGAIRVVSHNVLRASPASNPGAFARMYRALNPDIILVQEWDTDAAAVRAWFDEAMPEHAPWHVAMTPGLFGVGIVSRHPISASTADGTLAARTLAIGSSSVRFVAAVVSTPQGDVLAASTHLKCCGSAGSPEDERRLDEARAINAAFGAMATRSLAFRVIGGDMNLVGSRGPLDVLRNGLDADATDMDVAPALVLGDAAYYTWSDDGSPFSPGRLDYVIFSDSQARAARAFVVDTERLTDGALGAVGLRRDDSRASDHMPVVVDLLRR